MTTFPIITQTDDLYGHLRDLHGLDVMVTTGFRSLRLQSLHDILHTNMAENGDESHTHRADPTFVEMLHEYGDGCYDAQTRMEMPYAPTKLENLLDRMDGFNIDKVAEVLMDNLMDTNGLSIMTIKNIRSIGFLVNGYSWGLKESKDAYDRAKAKRQNLWVQLP